MIDARKSKILRVRSVEETTETIFNSTIYCPIGNNSECHIKSDDSLQAFQSTIINADDTHVLNSMLNVICFV